MSKARPLRRGGRCDRGGRNLILAEALVRSHVDALKRKMPEPQAAILVHALPPDAACLSGCAGGRCQGAEPGNLVADALADYRRRRPQFVGAGTESLFLTTGNPRQVSTPGHPVPAPRDAVRGSLTARAVCGGFAPTLHGREGKERRMTHSVAILGASGYTGRACAPDRGPSPGCASRR